MNTCTLLGRLGSDAELKVTAGGQAVLKFSLATSEKWKDKQDVLQEKTQWHRCVLWGRRAEALAQHLTKGSQIVVQGSIDYGSYDKDGTKVYTTDIKVFDVHFAGGKKEGGTKREDAPADDYAPTGTGDDSEIPF